jgi:hypothetical protein
MQILVVPRQNSIRMERYDSPARAVGHNGRALKRSENLNRRLDCGAARPHVNSAVDSSFASGPSSNIRQLGRSDGASRPGALETPPHLGLLSELDPPAFPWPPLILNRILTQDMERTAKNTDAVIGQLRKLGLTEDQGKKVIDALRITKT